jgi:hypothetical protein
LRFGARRVLPAAAAGAWAIAAAVLAAAGIAAAAPAPGSVADGTIAALDASSLTIATRAGAQVRAIVNADTRIIRRQAAKLEQIQPKDFIGVAAKREPDGTLVAVAINIFPPEFRGRVREGQFPMETGNVMTNAFVFQNVRRVEGRTLYLNFPEGRAVIQVPRDAEINKLTQVRLADLRAGMRVTVRGPAAADGTITAATVTAEDAAR